MRTKDTWRKSILFTVSGDSDLTSLTAEEFARYVEKNEPACFGHTLDDQIGAQIEAGFALTGFYEDDWGKWANDALSKHIKGFIATKATKPNWR